MPRRDDIKLSLCIPTYQRWNFLKNNLPKYIENPLIDEIVITDETGEDVDKIREAFSSPKLKLYKNERRLWGYRNKDKAVSLASNEWVALIDSDNFADVDYFQAWYDYIGACDADPACDVLFSPSVLLTTRYDFTPYEGVTITKQNVASYLERDRCLFEGLLNAGNYIVNKSFFLSEPDYDTQLYQQHIDSCYSYDSIFKNSILLLHLNAKLVIVPHMKYEHIVHNGSYWITTHSLSHDFYHNHIYPSYLK